MLLVKVALETFRYYDNYYKMNEQKHTKITRH